jgi:hypothetical protein
LHPEGQTDKFEHNNDSKNKIQTMIVVASWLDFRSKKQKEEGEMGRSRYAVVVLIILIFGCSGIQTRQQMSLFDKTSRAYDRAIRWGEYEEAFAFKKWSDKENRLPDFAEYRQIRVTSYKVKKTIVDEKGFSKVLRIVDIQYYRMSNVTVKTFVDRQKWEYNEEQDRWYLTSELPVFE